MVKFVREKDTAILYVNDVKELTLTETESHAALATLKALEKRGVIHLDVEDKD